VTKINMEDVKIRILRPEDYGAIVEIDTMVGGKSRPKYYERKLRRLTDSRDRIISSLVAEVDGRVVGFLMADVYQGEFGVPESQAAIDTIGVLPRMQRAGVARKLIEEFIGNMRAIGVTSVRTLVSWNDFTLVAFFGSQGFQPTPVLNLEMKI